MKDTGETAEKKKGYLEIAEDCLKQLGEAPFSGETQRQVYRILKDQFQENMTGRDQHVLQGKELERYLQIVKDCLKQLPNELFQTGDLAEKEYYLPYAVRSAFMCLKYECRTGSHPLQMRGALSGGNEGCPRQAGIQKPCLISCEAEGYFRIRDGRLYCSDKEINQTSGFLPDVLIELMEAEKESQAEGKRPVFEKKKRESRFSYLRIDASIDEFVLNGGLQLHALLNGEEISWKESSRFADKTFFGCVISKRRAFVLRLPLQECMQLHFELEDLQGNRMTVPMTTVDYQAKLTAALQHAYWCFGKYMAVFSEGRGEGGTGKPLLQMRRALSGGSEGCSSAQAVPPCALGAGKEKIKIVKAGKAVRMKQELKLLNEILTRPYGSRRMFLVRCLYWLSYPLYHRKKIWITFDKLYKGGDCGEYFYKFLKKEGKGITPVYVLKQDAPDWKRLEQEGYTPCRYGSMNQRLKYLHADMVFATHSSVHGFCGFNRWEVRFVQDRIRAVNTCIQHGLSVQDLTFDSNRVVNNNKRYYCASRCEVENLSKPAYDYAPDVLKLTGIPRYDGLINQDKKQILIAPTWRSYIAMPSVMGKTRSYNPDFKNTEYYKIFQSLLENRKLSETAAKTGYKIIYLLHPVISAQKGDFSPAGDIELAAAVDVNYEEILTQSSLMVTDYSGVQFDFAYMRKPVVYFHPPKLPPHYAEGGFFYDTQGFGEICQEREELVSVLCDYMENGCRLKDFYRARQDDFFAFDDHNSCRRIYEDALKL